MMSLKLILWQIRISNEIRQISVKSVKKSTMKSAHEIRDEIHSDLCSEIRNERPLTPEDNPLFFN